MTNYICINGRKAELTEEQMKALGIELHKKYIFSYVEGEDYYFITSYGKVLKTNSSVNRHDRHDVANYCTDKAIMEQRALSEFLNRLLWRYSMEHDGDKIDWSVASKNKYYIYYSYQDHEFCINYANTYRDIGMIYFDNYEDAENAIKEIIKPFMKAHPDFKF